MLWWCFTDCVGRSSEVEFSDLTKSLVLTFQASASGELDSAFGSSGDLDRTIAVAGVAPDLARLSIAEEPAAEAEAAAGDSGFRVDATTADSAAAAAKTAAAAGLVPISAAVAGAAAASAVGQGTTGQGKQ